MEVDQQQTEPGTGGEEDKVLGSGSSSLSVSLHPLVVMNISDHYTRVKVQEASLSKPPIVYGALLGTQSGRSVEICNSFELVVSRVEQCPVLDKQYFFSKEEQFKQVFSNMEFLGWYTVGGSPTLQDLHFHKQISADNENILLLKLNPLARTGQLLPISVFESLIEVVNGEPRILFAQVSYTLATEEAERIGVDHVARVSVVGSTQASAVAEQLSAQHGAVKMLYSRIKVVLDYLKAVQAGDLPRNHEILREISSLCHQLPVLESQSFEKEFCGQTIDVLLMSYLAAITKGLSTTAEFVSKMNLVFDHHGIGRRGLRGLLF